ANVIGTNARCGVPYVRHLIPETKTQRKVGFELPFVLDIPGGFRTAEVPWVGFRSGLQRAWAVLKHGQQASVSNGSGSPLRSSKQILLRLVDPNSCAPRVIALGIAQIVGPCLGKPSPAVRHVAIWRHNGSRGIRL